MVNQEDTGTLKNISVRKVLRFPFTYLFFSLFTNFCGRFSVIRT